MLKKSPAVTEDFPALFVEAVRGEEMDSAEWFASSVETEADFVKIQVDVLKKKEKERMYF